MIRLTVVGGTILETQRCINVPMRFGQRYLARERREVWLRGSNGRERKWIIHTRQLPARRGHRVALLLRKHCVVGMLNASTGAEVNYVRADPPFLLRGVDLLVIVATLILLPCFLGEAGLLVAVISIVAYLPAVIAARSCSPLVASRSSGCSDPTTALELASSRVDLIRSDDRSLFKLQYESQSSRPTSFAAAALASRANKSR